MSPAFKETTVEQIDKEHVQSIPHSRTRRGIFGGYLDYNGGISGRISRNFIQWISGSFITPVVNPADIDVVNLIPAADLGTVEAMEESKAFMSKHGSKDSFKVDGYIVPVFPQGHPCRELTQDRMEYWMHTFGKYRGGGLRTIETVQFLEGGNDEEA